MQRHGFAIFIFQEFFLHWHFRYINNHRNDQNNNRKDIVDRNSGFIRFDDLFNKLILKQNIKKKYILKIIILTTTTII